ncbi:hypothetical protein CN329_04435, partial [Bacillus cereus]
MKDIMKKVDLTDAKSSNLV